MNTPTPVNISHLRHPRRTVRAGVLACLLVIGAVAMPVAEAGHRGFKSYELGGTWRVKITTFNCETLVANPEFTSYLTFGADGSLIESTANPAFQPGQRGIGHGFWERTGRNFYRAVFEAFILFSTPVPPFPRGAQRIDQGIQMTGRDSFESDATVTFFDPTGAVVMSGCARAAGTRLE